MKTNLILAAAALAGAVLGALSTAPLWAADPAPPAQPAKKSDVCLRYSDVDGWGTRDKKTMVVSDRFNRKYLVGLSGLCDDIDFALGAGFRAPAGANIGCVSRGDRLVMVGGGVSRVGNNTCWVNKIQAYTKEMQAADRLARENKQPLASY